MILSFRQAKSYTSTTIYIYIYIYIVKVYFYINGGHRNYCFFHNTTYKYLSEKSCMMKVALSVVHIILVCDKNPCNTGHSPYTGSLTLNIMFDDLVTIV